MEHSSREDVLQCVSLHPAVSGLVLSVLLMISYQFFRRVRCVPCRINAQKQIKKTNESVIKRLVNEKGKRFFPMVHI
ncbi:hypothetical protein P3S68_006066 [Capsicum galapagoense]